MLRTAHACDSTHIPNHKEPCMTPLEALHRLHDLATSFFTAQAFVAGCQLGLFDHLAAAPVTAAELGQRLRLHPDGCQWLLDVLRQSGLLNRDQERYHLSDLGSFLTSASPVPLASLSWWT